MEIIQIDSKTWRFEDGFVRFFLLEGNERAVLIDSGVNCPNAADLVRSLTDKPVILLNTHGDGDHTSGTLGFTEIYIHPLDYRYCDVKDRYPGVLPIEIADGDIIELGNRPLRIIHIPGHTKGSVAILDINNRILFAGDSVQKGHIYMFGSKREPEKFASSLDKLIMLKDEYDFVYASHDEFLLPNDYVEKVYLSWNKVSHGEEKYEMIELMGNKVKSFTTDTCGFYLE